MRISELAELSRCGTETIRYYERIGLLPEAARDSNNYRQYSAEHVARLRFIRNCRSLDMTHDEIRALLNYIDTPYDNCSPVTKILREHIQHVEVRLQELAELKKQLLQLDHQCQYPGESRDCGILSGLTRMEPQAIDKGDTHLS